jgi:galactokinase
MNTYSSAVSKKFTDSFSVQPRIFFSPGRINLIGEHVDYNDGFVMPAAIDKGIYYAVGANETDEINFVALDFDECYSIKIEDIQVNKSWKNYVLSVVNEFLIAGKKIGGFNCVFSGDIPQGSGMSSSAAVEGGLAFALNEIFNAGYNRVELALLCQRAEHNFPNVQCGIMDQFANMMGKKDHVILLDCRSIQHQYFPLSLEGYKIVLINSNVHHSLAAGEYNIRRKRCEEGLAILKKNLSIQSFRDIKLVDEMEASKSEMSPEAYDCCRFVVEEIARTTKAAELLQENNIIEFGKLMYATHEGLSKLYKVSCEELDFLAEQAKKYPAVIGARLMGGGFGGCTINIVSDSGLDHFITETVKAYKERFDIVAEIYTVNSGDGTKEVSMSDV